MPLTFKCQCRASKEKKICYKMVYYTLYLSQSSENVLQIRIYTDEKLTFLKGAGGGTSSSQSLLRLFYNYFIQYATKNLAYKRNYIIRKSRKRPRERGWGLVLKGLNVYLFTHLLNSNSVPPYINSVTIMCAY